MAEAEAAAQEPEPEPAHPAAVKTEEEARGGERDGVGEDEEKGDVVGQVREGGEGEGEEAMDVDSGEEATVEETGASVKVELEIQVCKT